MGSIRAVPCPGLREVLSSSKMPGFHFGQKYVAHRLGNSVRSCVLASPTSAKRGLQVGHGGSCRQTSKSQGQGLGPAYGLRSFISLQCPAHLLAVGPAGM